MVKRHRASSSSLFLMELILAIMFFCIAGTICISVFAKAHVMHVENTKTDNAIRVVSNCAELIRSCESPEDLITTLNSYYSTGTTSGPESEPDFTVLLDKSFKPTAESTTPYSLNITIYPGDIYRFHIEVKDLQKFMVLYYLDIERGIN